MPAELVNMKMYWVAWVCVPQLNQDITPLPYKVKYNISRRWWRWSLKQEWYTPYYPKFQTMVWIVLWIWLCSWHHPTDNRPGLCLEQSHLQWCNGDTDLVYNQQHNGCHRHWLVPHPLNTQGTVHRCCKSYVSSRDALLASSVMQSSQKCTQHGRMLSASCIYRN